jgi:hypothetical protein
MPGPFIHLRKNSYIHPFFLAIVSRTRVPLLTLEVTIATTTQYLKSWANIFPTKDLCNE